MKSNLLAAILLLSSAQVRADETSAREGAAKPGETAPVPAAMPARPAVEPPVVRLPVPASGPVTTNSTVATSGATDAGAQLGWSSDGTELRSPAVPYIRTNRISEPRGVIPRVSKPERRTFGGFLAGVANLFNPFAPVEQGVAASGEHWYDGRINTAPLPRGFRDERSHEPKWELIAVPLERTPVDPVEPKSEPAPAPAPNP